MSLLNEIQRLAIQSEGDIASLLRMCRVLAARLQHQELKEWVHFELEGYPGGIGVPSYRVKDLLARGDFYAPLIYKMIPGVVLDTSRIQNAALRATLHTTEFRESVSSLQSTLNHIPADNVTERCPYEDV